MNLVYKYTSPSNKAYIGKTTQSREKRRKWEHKNTAKTNPKSAFHKAVCKYGYENFSYEVLINGVPDIIIDGLEIILINLHDTVANGYNMTSGGEGVDASLASELMSKRWQDEEAANKLRESMQGKPKTKSDAFYQAQSERTKGKPNKWNTIEYECPFCGKVGKGPNMKRYHFDKCKLST
jgi:group I intron endonuclease